MNYKKMIYLACFMSILLVVGNAPAANVTWNGEGGYIHWEDFDGCWDDGDNWDTDSVPGAGDTALLNADTEAEINSDMAAQSCAQVSLGHVSGPASLETNGGSLTTSSNILIGNGSGATGTWDISGGTISGGSQIMCGYFGTGTVNLTGGAISSAEKTVIGRNATGTGTWNMSGGTLSPAVHFFVGESGTGTLNLTGGTITVTVDVYLGVYSGSSGTVNLDGGTINARDLYMYSGRSSMDVTEGTLILDGNDVPTVQGYIDNGYITAYGGDTAASFNLDYNVTNAGKTTLTATGTATSRFGYAYNGPHNAPCTIQAEDFNAGRQYFAYHATSSGNDGNDLNYRSDTDVDIFYDSSSGVRYIKDSNSIPPVYEHLNYTFNVPNAGWFKFKLNGKIDDRTWGGRTFFVLVDGRSLCSLGFVNTEDFIDAWYSAPLYLSANNHVLKLYTGRGTNKNGSYNTLLSLNSITIADANDPNYPTPALVDVGNDIIIADISVVASPYNADDTGVNDCTTAVQAAIDMVDAKGGGVVYFPPGKYRFDGKLNVNSNIALIGHWKDPSQTYDINDITLLKVYSSDVDIHTDAYGNWDDPNTDPNSFIRLTGENATVKNLSIWYPEQNVSDPCTYPWTISFPGRDPKGIENITLFNSYDGIAAWKASAMHAKNLYGTVLNRGFVVANAMEYAYMCNVNFKNDYWKDADSDVITNAPTSQSEIDALNLYTTANTIGIELSNFGGGCFYDITVKDTLKGLLFNRMTYEARGPACKSLAKIDADIEFDPNTEPFSNYMQIDNIPEASSLSYTFQTMRSADPNNFYNVKNSPYNAVGDGVVDDTSAIQDALDDANDAGGGIVYLPVGAYKVLTHLTIHEDVELRGPFAAQHGWEIRNTCVLYAYEGRDTANPETDTAFITLKQDSGLRGVTIHYPQQGAANVLRPVRPFPYTIRGDGSGIWVADVYISCAYYGFDFATNRCDDLMIKDVMGSVLKRGMDIGGGSEDVTVEMVNFSHGMHTIRLSQNGPRYFSIENVQEYTQENLTAYRFGDCDGLTAFGVTSWDPHTGYYFHDDEEGSCKNATLWIGSNEGNRGFGCLFEDGDNINLIGFSTGVRAGAVWLQTESTFSGTVNLYEYRIWGTLESYVINGGTLNVYLEDNLATGKPVTASGYFGAADPNRAVDGRENTKWADVTAGTKWLQIDLGQPSEIYTFNLKNAGVLETANYNTQDANFLYSLDGTNWFKPVQVAFWQVKTEFSNFPPQNIRHMFFPYKRAKYVKINVVKGTPDGYDGHVRIPEISVIGKPGWNFREDDEEEGWEILKDISDYNSVSGRLEVAASGTNPGILTPSNLGIDLDALGYSTVKVKMMNRCSATTGYMYFKTADYTTFDGNSQATVTMTANDSIYREYTFDFSSKNDWTGTLNQLRFDLPKNSSGEYSIEYIKLE